MKYLFLILSALFSQTSSCQVLVKGTLIVAGIGNDGLIITADSRGSTGNREGKLIAYMDSIPKIFKIKNIYVAITGSWAIGNTFISTIISDFNKTKIEKTDFSNTIKEFVQYIDSLYPVALYPQSSVESFLFGGSDSTGYYLQGYMRDLGYTKLIRRTTIISDNNAVPYLGKYKDSYNFTCDTLAVAFKNVIYSYAKGANLDYEIGGPISVVCIGLNNELKYFKNSFSDKTYKSFEALIKDFKLGKRKFIPITPGGDKEAINAIIAVHQ